MVIGDTVVVRKINAVPAEMVIVSPLNPIPLIHIIYLIDVLEGIPIIKGDTLMVPYFGGRLEFQVTYLSPIVDAILISQNTILIVSLN